VECDVLPVEVCGLLLGRPWQYDHNVTHVRRENTYSFVHDDKKRTLKPIQDDQIKSDVELVVHKEKLRNVVVRYLRLMLSGTARQWINDLAENSIQTWFDMQTAFTKNLRVPIRDPITLVTSKGADGLTMRPPKLSLRDR
jgi:hypothetical protein